MSKADRTKAFIIEKTASLFNAKGFAGTSLNDITEATGLTKGSIYSNFKNKDEVALAVFDHNWGQLNHVITQAMSKASSVLEKLLVYPMVYETILKDPVLNFGCPILNTATESDDTHPRLRKRAETALVHWRNALKHMIELGIENGELKKQLDADDTSFALIAMIEGSIMISKLTGRVRDRERTRHSIEKFILNLRHS